MRRRRASSRNRSRYNEAMIALRKLVLLLLMMLPGVLVADTPPETVVRSVVDDALAIIGSDAERLETRSEEVAGHLEARVLSHVDLDRMGRFALGPHWRDASPEQRERFLAAFRGQVMATITAGLRDYAEELTAASRDLRIDYDEIRRRPDRAELRAAVHTPNYGTLSFDLLLHAEDGPWKLYDLRFAGVSMLVNYRSEFTSAVSREGMEPVIERMTSRANSN